MEKVEGCYVTQNIERWSYRDSKKLFFIHNRIAEMKQALKLAARYRSLEVASINLKLNSPIVIGNAAYSAKGQAFAV